MSKIAIGRVVTPDRSAPLTAKPAPVVHQLEIAHQSNAVIANAYAVLGLEISYYAKIKRLAPDEPLTEVQARIFGGHVRTLAKLVEQEIAAKKLGQLEQLTDEQLAQLGQLALKALTAKDSQ